jgi:hypothetical protein
VERRDQAAAQDLVIRLRAFVRWFPEPHTGNPAFAVAVFRGFNDA